VGTHLSIYALLELHDALKRRGRTALAERALEEALWGLDWSLRTRFAPGLRALYNHVSYWTDSKVGTSDDVVQDDARSAVGRDDFQNVLSVLAGARASRALRRRDPKLATSVLKAAREDFALVAAAIQPPKEAPPLEINQPSWRDFIGFATLAAIEMFRATGESHFSDEASRLAKWLVATQERSFVDGIGIAGYFYEDAGRTRIVHEYHNSFEDCGLLAFAALCESLPDHPDWMDWFAGLAIYADHFCAAGSRASAPFDIIPAAVWRRSDLDAPQPLDRTGMMLAQKPNAVFPTPPTPDVIRRQMQQQYDAGTKLGPNHALRVFPLWYDHVRKGSSTVHMSKTIGLGAAAAVLHRSDLSDLATRQVQWVLGANPFSRSLLYGVGNAFWQNFTVALPNFVGGMSLGFNSYEEDAPAWGNNAVFPYKEMWVYSSCRMTMNFSRVGTGARVKGVAPAGAEFRHLRTGKVTSLRPGRFDLQLDAGEYAVRYAAVERAVTLADGASLDLKLDPTVGKIAYSHLGYRTGSCKVAISGERDATTFDLLDHSTGKVFATLPVTQITTRRGTFALLDFSNVNHPGRYRLRCASAESEAFEIADQLWMNLIDTTLNSFNGFRCGCPVPGVHDTCHLDTFVEYNGERRVAGGGWHDAANLTQFGDLTHLSIFALLRLYEQLQQDPHQRDRASRTLEEVQWGLDWALRMRFGPGLRQNKTHQGYWTNGVVGDADDMVETNVERNLRENIFAVAPLASAARILRHIDPKRARAALSAAIEDYAEIAPSVVEPLRAVTLGDGGRGTWRDLVAYLTLAAVELHRLTGAESYAADAKRFGAWLVDLQETRFLGGSPVTGYFYAGADRNEIQREVFGSCDDAGLLAFQALCAAFPESKGWMEWYAALLIYSEYYCAEGATASAPYHVLPASVWRRRDVEAGFPVDKTGEALAQHSSPIFPTPPTKDLVQAQALEMFDAGVALNEDTRLRVFPLWYNHVQHGSSTAHLSRTIGLSCAAQARIRMPAADLAERQLQWLLGANPFSRSLIYGVGYDYWDNFTVSLTNFVGGMGMGMNSYLGDSPAWPNNAVFPYKEQWVYSANRLALSLAYTSAQARIHGVATVPVELIEMRTGKSWRIPKGHFQRLLPPGIYSCKFSSARLNFELSPGSQRQLMFDPDQFLQLDLTFRRENASSVRVGFETHAERASRRIMSMAAAA